MYVNVSNTPLTNNSPINAYTTSILNPFRVYAHVCTIQYTEHGNMSITTLMSWNQTL